MFCAGRIAQSGLTTLVIDHAKKPAEKVRISGGGRCNFTNIHTNAKNFLSQNPHFAKSALARYTPVDFLTLLARYKITWHEKTLGQLFCDERSGAIITMLLNEVQAGNGSIILETNVDKIQKNSSGFTLTTNQTVYNAKNVVIATGGLSIPKMGATGFAYEIGRQFGLTIIEPRPALVPFEFDNTDKRDFASISGVAVEATVTAGDKSFQEAMLFTHRGLSGPVILQASSYWAKSEKIDVMLCPEIDMSEDLKSLRDLHPRRSLAKALENFFPSRLVEMLSTRKVIPDTPRMADLSNAAIDGITTKLKHWQLTPSGTEGWRTAEVTAGGIDTNELSSKTMESRHVSGLYFIGECVDVTGWLGGYNFQWAWASAAAAADAICSK